MAEGRVEACSLAVVARSIERWSVAVPSSKSSGDARVIMVNRSANFNLASSDSYDGRILVWLL